MSIFFVSRNKKFVFHQNVNKNFRSFRCNQRMAETDIFVADVLHMM